MSKNDLSGSAGVYPARYAHLDSSVVAYTAQALLRTCPPKFELTKASPVSIPETPGEQCLAFLQALVQPGKFYSLVGAQPTGELLFPGVTLPSAELLEVEVGCGLPKIVSGGLIRFNSVTVVGSGYEGNYCDHDVTSFELALIESDFWPVPVQKELISSMIGIGVPVLSVVSSGGKSLHVLVRIGAEDLDDFREKRRALFNAVVPLGFDPATCNPSRLTRLPGCMRRLKDGTESRQELLYLA